MKPNKLTLITTFICGIGAHFTALANDNGANASIYNGFYVGINGGVIQTNANISNNVFADSAQALSQNAKITQIQGGATLYFGYGQLISCSNFYFGGEIFGDLYSRSTAINNSSFQAEPGLTEVETLTTQTKAKLSNGEVGIDLRPGLLLDPATLVYARVGAAFNKLSLTSNANFSFEQVIAESSTKNATGLRLGLGLESYICKNTALTADYVYTTYGSINITGQAPDSAITSLSNQTSANLKTQMFAVGIKYYFG
jgi:opacity protein-like surface antigen